MRKIKYVLIVLAFVFVLCLTGCKSNKIDAPTNISIDEDNKLVWDAVSEAKTYTISFYYVDKDITFEDSTRKTNYSLSDLEEGDYEISIRSDSGDKSKKDSVFSEKMFYHKYFETGCVYTLINNKTEYQISKVGKANGSFEIEDYYRGKAVTAIADAAFKGSTRVTGIVIGANVMTIGNNAFYNCSKLESVVLPNNVTSLGENCFQSCKNLKEIVIPDSIDIIPKYCFAYCRNLKNVTLNEYITSLEESCFQDCSSLESINIPDSVKKIDLYAFSSCTSLKNVNVGTGVESFGDYCFNMCTSLESVSFRKPSSLKSTGDRAFFDCASLKSVELPDGFESMARYTFNGCTSLESVKIPESCKKVGIYSFNRTKIYQDALDKNEKFLYADNWLVYCFPETLATIEEINTETLKDTIVGVADGVFKKAPLLKTLVLPASFKYIGTEAFASCPYLWKFRTLDNSIKSIGDYAFTNCALTNISLGIGLEEIGNYAFYGNTQLDNNTLSPYSWIPESVTRIGTLAFKNTKMWTNALQSNRVVYAANWVIGYNDDNLLIHPSSIELNFDTNRVAGIADYAFYKLEGIQTVTGLSNCRYIGKGAFQGCTSLTSVSLNRNLTEIKDFTFYGCSNLIKVTLPRTLTKIGNYAFYDCSLISELDLASTNCKTIGKSAFYRASNLKEVSLSKSLTSIGDYAFYKCEALEEITFTSKIESIGVKSFYKCTALKTVNLNDGLKTISEGAFNSCEALESITLPSTIETVEKSAFYKCAKVKELELNEGLKTIGDYAFYGLTGVSELDLPTTLEKIGNYAFKGLDNVKVLYLSKDVKTIGQHAFYGCKNMTIYTDAKELQGEWHYRFNTSYRPIFYGCTFDSDGSVESIMINSELFQNKNASNGVNAPTKNGLEFVGWTDDESNTYSMEDLLTIEKEGKLVAKYE